MRARWAHRGQRPYVREFRGVTAVAGGRTLGFPDAIPSRRRSRVDPRPARETQVFLVLAQRQDETATRITVQGTFEWLESSGEGELLRCRPQAWARILSAVASAVGDTDGAASPPRVVRGRS